MPAASSAPLRSATVQRLLVTVGALLAYRLGCHIPIPGIDTNVLHGLSVRLTIETISIFALGVTPIFSALLFFEFVKIIIPPLARWETTEPRNVRRLQNVVYVIALLMAAFQARGVANGLYGIPRLVDGPGWGWIMVATWVAATALLGWLGDRITRQGIGTGFWLLLITPTLIKMPEAIWFSYEGWQRALVTPAALVAAAVFFAVAIALIATVGQAREGTSAMEYRVSGADFASVWPPLFATTIAGLVVTVLRLATAGPVHLTLIALLILGFTGLQRYAARPRQTGARAATRPTWSVALVQIAVCVVGVLLAEHLTLPFSIDGSWLIIVVTAAMSCVRSIKSA
jgi:preprotein translocase subunit SecY